MGCQILTGDAVSMLRTMAAGSVHCVVTSPPYYGLRDYGAAGQIGLESSPAEYVDRLVAVFAEVWRVLRDDGTLWVNIGDSYANDGKWGGTTGGKHVSALHGDPVGRGKRETGLKPKDLIGIPWRLAFALQDAGWYLRSEIIWAKRAPMPESVQDRPTSATEKIFLLTKRARYFYDAVAVQEEAVWYSAFKKTNGKILTDNYHGDNLPVGLHPSQNTGRNLRNFWLLSPDPYADAHFATFPREIPKRAILAGTSAAGCCPTCGAPWRRVVGGGSYTPPVVDAGDRNVDASRGDKTRKLNGKSDEWIDAAAGRVTLGWLPSCSCYGVSVPADLFDDIEPPEDARGPFSCDVCGGTGFAPESPMLVGHMPADLCPACEGVGSRAADPEWVAWRAAVDAQAAEQKRLLDLIGQSADKVPAVVIDPFLGSGTTLEVATSLGRHGVGCELNPAYVELAHKRIGKAQPALMGL